jgi:hypothetical protein
VGDDPASILDLDRDLGSRPNAGPPPPTTA